MFAEDPNDDMPPPGATTIQLRVSLALFSSVRQIERVVQKNLRGAFSCSMAKFDILAQLYRASTGLSMSELSSRLMVTNGAVTGVVRGMVAEGLINRDANGTDRRIQRVSLSQQGLLFFSGMAPENQSWIAQVMEGLSETELLELYRLLSKLTASVKERRQRFAGDGCPGEASKNEAA